MFDTHTHLQFPELLAKLEEIIGSAHNAGVTHILVPGTDIESSQKAIEIAEAHENIFSAVGIHPCDVLEEDGAALEIHMNTLRSQVESSQKVVAIGEIGLDRYFIHKILDEFSDEAFEIQKSYFASQLQLSLDMEKPVIVHNRQSRKALIKVLEDNWDSAFEDRMVIHCCEADEVLLAFAIAHNIYIGVDGDVTYSASKQEFVKKVPLQNLVLETDAPFLTPEPVRDQPYNEPKNLIYIAQKIAELQSVQVDELISMTRENSMKLFNLQ